MLILCGVGVFAGVVPEPADEGQASAHGHGVAVRARRRPLHVRLRHERCRLLPGRRGRWRGWGPRAPTPRRLPGRRGRRGPTYCGRGQLLRQLGPPASSRCQLRICRGTPPSPPRPRRPRPRRCQPCQLPPEGLPRTPPPPPPPPRLRRRRRVSGGRRRAVRLPGDAPSHLPPRTATHSKPSRTGGWPCRTHGQHARTHGTRTALAAAPARAALPRPRPGRLARRLQPPDVHVIVGKPVPSL